MLVKVPRSGQVRALAQRVSDHPRIQQAVHIAVRNVLPEVIEDCIASMFPDVEGDYVKLLMYRRKRTRKEPAQRDERIAAAIRRGEAVSIIARRETVSERHVFRVKARAVTNSPP